MAFLTEYLRVSQCRVMQVEVHPLCLGSGKGGQGWFADKHFQEILQLVKEFVQERVSLSWKSAPASRALILTGPSLRLAYAFRKRPETHTCLTLRTGEQTGFGSGGEYCWNWVHGEKLVVYVQPLGRGKDAAVQKLLTVMPDGHQPKVDISSYFVRSPRNSQVGTETVRVKRNEAMKEDGAKLYDSKEHKSAGLPEAFTDGEVTNSVVGNKPMKQLAVGHEQTNEGQNVKMKDSPQDKLAARLELPAITVSTEVSQERVQPRAITLTPEDSHCALGHPTLRLTVLDAEDVSELSKGSATKGSCDTDPCSGKVAVSGEQDSSIKLTLKKFNSKLSKQYKKRGKLRTGRSRGMEGATGWLQAELLEHERLDSLPDLPDLTSPVVESSETDTGITSPVRPSTATSETDLGAASNVWKKRLGGNKRPLRGLIGSESDSTHSVPEKYNHPKRGGGRSTWKQKLTVPNDVEAETNSLSETADVSPSGNHSSVFHLNNDIGSVRQKKRPLFDNSTDGEASTKVRKTTKFMKGKSYHRRTPDTKTDADNYSQLKDCSIHLERLSGEELLSVDQGQHGDEVYVEQPRPFPRSPINSSSGLRVSRRMSQIFDQCETSGQVIEIDSDAEGELGGILEDATSQMSQAVKTEEEQATWSAIRTTRDVDELTSEQLTFLVLHNEGWLRDIFQGKMYCTRHQDYKAGGKTRRDLMYQLYFGKLSDEQTEAVMDTLISLFCRNHNKYLDYLMKVLLPEMFVKVYMEVFGVDYTAAETMIRNCKVPVPVPTP